MALAMSLVAPLCWEVATAIERAIMSICSIASPTVLVPATTLLVWFWIALMYRVISSVACAVWLARVFTSDATTAKPRPASPARAASIVALSARRLVCSAMARISVTTSPIEPEVLASSSVVDVVTRTSPTALSTACEAS